MDTSKITKFIAKDVMRLSVVEITPDGNVVTIGGRNEQGKTSLLDAIQMMFAGKASIRQTAGKKVATKKPVRDGAIQGTMRAELGDLIVERTVFDNEPDKLVVKSRDGAHYPRPQEVLNKLFNAVSFNPLQFVDLEPAKQVETLRSLAGVDFTALDGKRAELYEERTIIGRDVATLKGQYEGAPFHDDAAPKEVVVSELMADLEAAQSSAQQKADLKYDVDEAKRAHDATVHALDTIEGQIKELKKKLKQAKLDCSKTGEAHATAVTAWDAHVEIDQLPIKTKLNDAEAINKKVRDNAAHKDLLGRYEAKKVKQDELTTQIDALDAKKKKALAEAKFPVDGLSFDDNGVSCKGIPFNQCSRSQQIRISMAIGMALNPKLRVLLVRDASLIDEDGLKLLAQIAQENDYQFWLEDSRTQDPTAIIIEDGRVREKAKAAE
jgi:hypothetical protein